MAMSKIPVTIITGFLGAGKTTLLNYLISHNKEKRFAVIENEFGEVGIDGALVMDAKEGIFELSNGCLCCTLNDDLINVLQKILNRESKIDHLLVETTGIADPGPIAMSFLSDPHVKEAFYIDGIITLTDAQFIEQQLEDQEIACNQVTMADVIIINKIDKVDSYQTDTVNNILKRMNPGSQIIFHGRDSAYEIDLLRLNAFSEHSFLSTFNTLKKHSYSYQINSSNQSSLLAPTKQVRHAGIHSHTFVFKAPLDVLKFNIFIRALLTEQLNVFRIKGILNLNSVEEKILFQAVNSQYATDSMGPWISEDEKETKIVFIGKDLNKTLLQESLDLCSSGDEFEPEFFYNQLNRIISGMKK